MCSSITCEILSIKYSLQNYNNNNNNNNCNNIYSLQLNCHPVAVVILHVHKYIKKKVSRKFKSGGLHENHVVATWKQGNHLSIRL